MNNTAAKKALITGQGEIVRKDGTVIPITLRAETTLSLDEVRERTGLPIENCAIDAQEE